MVVDFEDDLSEAFLFFGEDTKDDDESVVIGEEGWALLITVHFPELVNLKKHRPLSLDLDHQE